MSFASDLESVIQLAATSIAAVGLLLALTLAAVTRDYDPALPVLLDFLMAAGLLRLTTEQDWRTIGSAALVVAIRRLVSAGLRTARRSRQLAQP